MDRRNFIIGSAAAASALASATAGAQDAYPTHAITFVNPFPPGGVADVIGRPLAAALEPVLKQPCVVETKAGAAGAVGAQVAASAKPDGYTLLVHIVSISGFAEVDKLFGRTPKFTNADFIPIARFVADPIVLVVNDQVPYKTLKDLIEDAKANPNKIIFSSSGLYGASHIPTALFAASAGGLQMRHLPTPAAGRRSRRCSATTRSSSCRRPRSRCRRSRAASCARSRCRAPARRRRCPTCRRSRSRGSTSNITSGSACSRPRARPRR